MAARVVDVLAVARSDRRPGGRIAIADARRALSYDELDERVGARAADLEEEGLRPGAAVVRVVESDLDGVVDLLALWRIGAVAVPLNAASTPTERAAATRALDGAEVAAQVVLWTSGTSGQPRGVALSFENLAASARGAEARLGLGAEDVWLASLSPAHVGGVALLTRSLLLGGAMVAVGRFDASSAARLIDGEGLPDRLPGPVSHASFVPTQLLRLLDARGDRPPPASFRCALIGGAHAPVGLVARAERAGWPLALTYGCTEMTSQIATTHPWRREEVRAAMPGAPDGSVGTALEGVEIRIGDEEEILARGPTMALGYVGPGGALRPVADEAGWYHTGDLGRMVDQGRLLITGRRIDRIVSGGVTVDAVEVEEALRSHPSVADAAVVGVSDAEWGERLAAWIEPASDVIDQGQLADYMRERVAPAKVPRAWYVGMGLPRNANGKVDRAAVRARLEAASAP